MPRDKVNISGLPNQLQPEPGCVSCGQPSEQQLAAAAQAGVRRVINLRPASEDAGFDEARVAARLRLDYATLAIAGAPDLNPDNVRRFDALLAKNPEQPTLIHCGSGNRVGALMALRAGWVQHKPAAEALAIGRSWGLTKLEPAVTRLLAKA